MIILLNSFIALIALLILLYLLEKDLGLAILSFMILIQYIWMFFSLIVIESGIYINEQGRFGYFAYSSIVLFLFYLSTLFSLIFFKKFFKVVFKNLKSTKIRFFSLRENQLTKIFLFSILFIAFFNLYLSPIPFFSEKVTKFNFWEFARFPALQAIVGNVMAFVGFGAALLFKKNKKTAIFLLILYFLYLTLLGQKFTGFIIGIYGILLALYFSSEGKIKFKLKWIFNKYFIGVLVLLFGLVLYKYTQKNPFKYMGLSPLQSVFYRTFGLQGHVFWGVTERYLFLDEPHTWKLSELWQGMHHLMLEFWPWRYEDFISVTSRNVSWTNAYPSILIRLFPLWIALIVNFLLLSVVSLFQVLLSKFIKRGALLLSIVFFQLLSWVNYAYTMAYFYKLTIPFIMLMGYFLYKYINYKKK